jgi:hypothetical protein
MNYLKFTPYLYLILGFFLVIDSIIKWNNPTDNPGLTLVFAGLAFFLFAFRRRYAKRFEERRKNTVK